MYSVLVVHTTCILLIIKEYSNLRPPDRVNLNSSVTPRGLRLGFGCFSSAALATEKGPWVKWGTPA